MSESQTLKTMVHETAHALLHNKEVDKADIFAPVKDRNTKEVEAESIAFTVCNRFGIDTSKYSFGYIAGWSSGSCRNLETDTAGANERYPCYRHKYMLNNGAGGKALVSGQGKDHEAQENIKNNQREM